VVSVASAPKYAWGDHCDGWRLVDDADLSVTEERVPAGGFEEWHVHDNAHQFFYMLSGSAEMRTSEGNLPLNGPGAGVDVPAGVAHQFTNVGTADTRFLVISTPTTSNDRRPVSPFGP